MLRPRGQKFRPRPRRIRPPPRSRPHTMLASFSRRLASLSVTESTSFTLRSSLTSHHHCVAWLVFMQGCTFALYNSLIAFTTQHHANISNKDLWFGDDVLLVAAVLDPRPGPHCLAGMWRLAPSRQHPPTQLLTSYLDALGTIPLQLRDVFCTDHFNNISGLFEKMCRWQYCVTLRLPGLLMYHLSRDD